MSKWILQRKAADYKGLSEKLKVDPVIVRLMVNRGLSTYEEMEEYLHPSLDNFPDPHLFADMDEACGLLMDAIELAVNMGQVSASMIQRKFKVGYARAGRIVDQMEERGIITGHEGSKPRQVLISKQEWEEMKEQGEEEFDSASNE